MPAMGEQVEHCFRPAPMKSRRASPRRRPARSASESPPISKR